MKKKNNILKKIADKAYEFGFVSKIKTDIIESGLNEDTIRLISSKKNEPDWMLEFRLTAYRHWLTMEMPQWAHLDIPPIDYQAISYYADPLKKSKESKNKEIDNKIQVLTSLNVAADFDNAEELYAKYVKREIPFEGGKSFKVLKKIIFECEKDGKTYFVLPQEGAGLWGPIWGYLALESDKNTIYGAYFSHKGETPGLGAEISTPKFQSQFVGKHIFRDGNLVSVAVVKPGKIDESKDYVDIRFEIIDHQCSKSDECQ